MIANAIKNRWVQTAAISVGTFAGGMAIGYILGKRAERSAELQRKYDAVSGEIAKDLASIYETKSKENLDEMFGDESTEQKPVPIPEGLEQFFNPHSFVAPPVSSKARVEHTISLLGKNSEDEPVDPKTDISLRPSSRDGWDYDVETAKRSVEHPYVIHVDEFMENESEYAQETITYYVMDDILADSRDTPIFKYASIVGDEFRSKWGHGSNDPDIVYIRSDTLEHEWEILLNPGSFEQEVLGVFPDGEIRHSVRKFRPE